MSYRITYKNKLNREIPTGSHGMRCAGMYFADDVAITQVNSEPESLRVHGNGIDKTITSGNLHLALDDKKTSSDIQIEYSKKVTLYVGYDCSIVYNGTTYTHGTYVVDGSGTVQINVSSSSNLYLYGNDSELTHGRGISYQTTLSSDVNAVTFMCTSSAVYEFFTGTAGMFTAAGDFAHGGIVQKLITGSASRLEGDYLLPCGLTYCFNDSNNGAQRRNVVYLNGTMMDDPGTNLTAKFTHYVGSNVSAVRWTYVIEGMYHYTYFVEDYQ